MIAWHREMAEATFTRSTPTSSLVSTSFWGTNPETNPRTWNIPEIGFTQTHNYDGALHHPHPDRANARSSVPKAHIAWRRRRAARSLMSIPTAIEFHNCLWAGSLSVRPRASLPWHAIERKEPNKSLLHYAAVEEFARQVPWISEKLL